MKTADDEEKNTPLDIVSRDVPDAMVPEDSEESQKAYRALMVEKCIRVLGDITEKLTLVEKVMGQALPGFLKESPLGVAVDTISTFHGLYSGLSGDASIMSAIGGRVNYCKEVTMPNRMDEEAVKTFNTERFRVTRTAKLYASILNADTKDAAYDWLRANDFGSLIKETVNASSLSAAAKELVENGRELPDDMFKVHTKDSISITKKK